MFCNTMNISPTNGVFIGTRLSRCLRSKIRTMYTFDPVKYEHVVSMMAD